MTVLPDPGRRRRSSPAPTSRPAAARPCRPSGRCCDGASPAPGATERRRGRGQLAAHVAEQLRQPTGLARRRSRTRRRRDLDARGRSARATSTPHGAASAARRSSRRRWCWSSCCATHARTARRRDARWRWPSATLRGDGPRRDLRPARRRLRALLRRRRLGRPALREDALRQRPAAAGLRCTGGGRPATRWRERVAARDRRLPARRAAAPPRAASPPRWTPTREGRRGR